jgi:hypothetical protein
MHTQPASPRPDLPRPPGLSVRTTVLVVTAAFAALAGVGALIAGPPPAPAPAGRAVPVRLEPISSAGPHPFLAPVGTDVPIAAPADPGGRFSSDTPGLYGDSGGAPSCDPAALTRELRAAPAAAAAWAAALGIDPGRIAGFVDTLTPVLLRSDTAVTSYGYADGRFTAYPAVLQAGTAALVDGAGAPTVKCFDGDPLSAPAPGQDRTFTGPAWPGFQPTTITVIQPAAAAVAEYTLIDVAHGTRVHRRGRPGWPDRRAGETAG